MASVDNGGQKISFDFQNVATGQDFNRLNYQVLYNGIYTGGQLLKVSNTQVEVEPLIGVISDSSAQVSVRLETTTNASVNVSASTPFIIMRFSWLNVTSNYADFLALEEANILEGDLIVGRAVFNGATLESFDYTRQSFVTSLYEKQSFRVEPQEPYADTVKVTDGVMVLNGNIIEFSESDSESADLPTTQSRKDLVCINDEGDIKIVKGVESATPVIPKTPNGMTPLAYINFPASASVIRGDYIQQLNFPVTASDNGPKMETVSTDYSLSQYNRNLTINCIIGASDLTLSFPVANEHTLGNQCTVNFISSDGGQLLGLPTSEPLFTDRSFTYMCIYNGSTYSWINLTQRVSSDAIGTVKMFDANTPATIDSVPVTAGIAGAWIDNQTIPGWYACVSANASFGCPNLVDKFVMGKVENGAIGSTGGSNTHTITEAQLPSHSHDMGHTHSGSSSSSGASHSHSYYRFYKYTASSGTDSSNVGPTTLTGTHSFIGITTRTTSSHIMQMSYTSTSNGSANHTHTITVNSVSGDTGDTGSGNSFDSRPSFYSMIYIRKCI